MSSEFQEIVEIASTMKQIGPVIIVFANSKYKKILENWLGYMKRLGKRKVLICALDVEVAKLAAQNGYSFIHLPFARNSNELFVLRAQVFAALARSHIDFIHSDCDAIWLRDPIPRISDLNVDIAFSQGTIWPPDVAVHWGFVLCAGFFAARASDDVGNFFEEASSYVVQVGDDQIALNRMLLGQSVHWHLPPDKTAKTWISRGRDTHTFFTYSHPVIGQTPTLKIALLPFDEFARLPERTHDCYVAHPLSIKSARAKIDSLKELGLWAP